MRLLKDIFGISLSRLMGALSFVLVCYCIITQKPIDYVQASIYVLLIVWGAVFGKKAIDIKGIAGTIKK
jgi:hypothetical protein